MSERLGKTSSDYTDSGHIEETADAEGSRAESWATGEHYARMNIEAGSMGDAHYYSLPAFTILTKTKEELDAINDDFSTLLSKYTDQLIVGTSHEASLILSINQASADLAQQNDIINFLRDKIKELTGSYEAAGDWGRVDR